VRSAEEREGVRKIMRECGRACGSAGSEGVTPTPAQVDGLETSDFCVVSAIKVCLPACMHACMSPCCGRIRTAPSPLNHKP